MSEGQAGDDEHHPASRYQPIATYEDLTRSVTGILAIVTGIYDLFVIWNPEAAMLESSP